MPSLPSKLAIAPESQGKRKLAVVTTFTFKFGAPGAFEPPHTGEQVLARLS